MRNLKKILALVLALVMSLSLMATASAGTFADVPDDSSYKTATDVLNGLQVFKGYQDGSFQPEKTISRAEVATIIYRIATGDVENAQNSIYTTWNKFTDVKDTDWYAGYVNYCANAEYVKGNGDGTFAPRKEVNGYAVLAMILRAMGWDANHEFEGKDWVIQTAAIGRQEGLLKGITEEQLGQPAPRGMVAQILFNALLTETVQYSVLGGYQHTGKTLGYEQFKLESVTGVVMANEWANLNDEVDNDGDKVLAAGNTEMLLADGTTYKVAISSDLDDVGLTCTAYMADQDNDGVREVLTEKLVQSDINVVDYNEGAYATVDGLASTKLTNDTEYFVNYTEWWDEEATSDILIRYAVAKDDVDEVPAWEEFINVTLAGKNRVSERKITVTMLDANGKKIERDVECYVRTIQPTEEITVIDQQIMQSIFYTADRLVEANIYTEIQDYVYGEVYVGTASTKDVSDTMSWKAFQNEYFIVDVNARKFGSVGNGNSLRIIDNNGDGKAEYVLAVCYTQAKAVDTLTSGLLFSANTTGRPLRLGDYTDNNLDAHDELALGDIANYYVIDGKLSIWKAVVVTDKVTTKNWQDVSVTLASGDKKEQSAIWNDTTLEDNILNMSDKPEYNMYLDEYGYIRTYELAQGKKYALLTEMYNGVLQNYNYITTTRWIVEMKSGNDALTERYVTNNGGSVFATPSYAWTSRDLTLNGNNVSTNNSLNYLQPATAHLGLASNVAGTATGGAAPLYRNSDWKRNVFAVGLDEMFDYGRVLYTKTPSGADAADNSSAPNSFSFTNVAVYTLEDEAVWLETASKLYTNTSGYQMYRATADLAATTGNDYGLVKTEADWQAAYLASNRGATDAKAWFDARVANKQIYAVYATDYVQLAKQDVAAGTRHYTIDENYSAKYNTLSNGYVDATVKTEYYIVTPNKVDYLVGYDSLYSIDASNVRAAYAVAQNTDKDADGQDYWVADVIVIEVDEVDYDYDSIALMYNNPWETNGQVRNVNSLNNQWRALQPEFDGLAKMDVVPASTNLNASVIWGNHAWTGTDYNFYRLYDTNPTENTNGNMTAGDAKIIDTDWNDYGIYAGTVKRITTILDTSNYIDIDLDGNNNDDLNVKHITVKGDAFKTPVYRINGTVAGQYSANTINLLNDPSGDRYGVQIGDPVIVVYNNTGIGQAAYIVDVRAGADLNNDGRLDWNVPAYLTALYNRILASQVDAPVVDDNPITITDVAFTGNPGTAWTTKGTTPNAVLAKTGVDEYSITLDNYYARNAALEFDTNATTVNIYKDGSLLTGGGVPANDYNFAAGTVTLKAVDLTGASNAAGKVVYSIVLAKSATDVPRTVTVTVNILASSTDARVNSIKVKDIPAWPVTGNPGAGTNANPFKYAVTLSADEATAAATTTLALSLAHPVGDAVTISNADTTTISTTYSTAISSTGSVASGTLKFNVTAEDGTTKLYYEVEITAGAKASTPTYTQSGSSNWNGTDKVLTVPANASVTTGNLSTYLTITDGSSATSVATVVGNTITVVTTETGKETITDTLTWQRQKLAVDITAVAGTAADYKITGGVTSGTITLLESGAGMPLSARVPIATVGLKSATAGVGSVLGSLTITDFDVTYVYEVMYTGTSNVWATLANGDNLGTAYVNSVLQVTVSATIKSSVAGADVVAAVTDGTARYAVTSAASI